MVLFRSGCSCSCFTSCFTSCCCWGAAAAAPCERGQAAAAGRHRAGWAALHTPAHDMLCRITAVPLRFSAEALLALRRAAPGHPRPPPAAPSCWAGCPCDGRAAATRRGALVKGQGPSSWCSLDAPGRSRNDSDMRAMWNVARWPQTPPFCEARKKERKWQGLSRSVSPLSSCAFAAITHAHPLQLGTRVTCLRLL